MDNDSDGDGDPLEVVQQQGSRGGILTLKPNGSFTYLPREDFRGRDSFSYVLNDGRDNSAPITVTIQVGEGGADGGSPYRVFLPLLFAR